MDLIYLICCGLDVHKKTVVASIAYTNNITLEVTYVTKSFSTMNSDILKLHDWLLASGCHDVCMESTGKYWIPIFNILGKDIHVVLTHPKYVKAIIAIACMMLVAIYHIIRYDADFNLRIK